MGVHDVFDRQFIFALADFNIQEPGLKRLPDVFESDSKTQCPPAQRVKVARRKKAGWNLVRAAMHHRFGTLDKHRKKAGLLSQDTFQTGYDLVDLWSDNSDL